MNRVHIRKPRTQEEWFEIITGLEPVQKQHRTSWHQNCIKCGKILKVEDYKQGNCTCSL